jgi:two-component system chemotaxis response regulator CheB
MINVLVVDDSSTVRELLLHIFRADPEINVMGTAADGQEALEFIQRQRPDVVTMDIEMPRLNGLQATRQIMETRPLPIVIVSANWNPNEVATTFQAMEAGAVALAEKPRGIHSPDYPAMSANLIRMVKAMAEVHVIRRLSRAPAPRVPQSIPVIDAAHPIQVIAIGVSTGGPPVLHNLLSRLPPDLPVPILIVQHIAAGFVEGLAQWLGQGTGWKVQLAEHGRFPLPGHAYLAPDGAHLCVGPGGRMRLTHDEPENALRPAASCLFRSVAAVHGPQAIGVLLTGMGKDGAEELKLMRERGAVTIAQDRESSIVHGMPGEAIRLGAAVYVLPPEQIATTLINLVHAQRRE